MTAAMLPSQMNRAAFVARFGGVFEHSAWIAEESWDRGLGPAHDTAPGLHALMMEVLSAARDERKLTLIRAHPDLAGKLAVAGDLTAESTAEQASAGLDRCTPEELARFQDLNGRYRDAFGFPFVMAVRGATRAQILERFTQRLANSPAVEMETALAEIGKIARMRLDGLLAG